MGKSRYLIKNLIRGFILLIAFILIYIIFKRYVKVDFLVWLEPLFEKELLIFLIFLCSEVVIGIIPPEIFMIWALRYDSFVAYVLIVSLLALVSYFAGIMGFFIGRYLNRTLYYRYIRIRFLRRMDKRLHDFGLYLIVIAALTPIPFSGVAMLIGSVRYSFPKYLLFSLFRFLRFGIYACIFWKIRLIV